MPEMSENASPPPGDAITKGANELIDRLVAGRFRLEQVEGNIRRAAKSGYQTISSELDGALALTMLAAEAVEARRLRSTPLVLSREGAAAPDLRAALHHVESPTELLKIITDCAAALDGGPRQALCDVDILLALAAYADEALRAARRREAAR